MFQAWHSFGEFQELIDLIRSNYAYWQGQQRLRESSVTSTTSTASAPAVIQSTTSGAAVHANADAASPTGDTSVCKETRDEIDGGVSNTCSSQSDAALASPSPSPAAAAAINKLSKSTARSCEHPLSDEKVLPSNRKIDSKCSSTQKQGIKESNVSNTSPCTSRSSSSPLNQPQKQPQPQQQHVTCYNCTVDDLNDIQCITDTISDNVCKETSTCKLLTDPSDITCQTRRLQSNNILAVSSKPVASDHHEDR